jgi:hypothetical protein
LRRKKEKLREGGEGGLGIVFDLGCVGENIGYGDDDKGVGLVGDSWSRVGAGFWIGAGDSAGGSLGIRDEGEGFCTADRAGRKGG